MKKFITILLVMLLVVSCVMSVAGEQAQAAEGNIKIAAFLKTLANDHWVSMKKGFVDQAEKMGVKVDVYAVKSEGDIQGQLQLVENALGKGYDGFSISPITPLNLITAIVAANKKGIPCVNVDEAVNLQALKDAGGKVAAFIRTDNYAIGQKAANFVASKIAGGKVAILEGMAGNSSGDARREGFRDRIKEISGFEVVASQPADWDRIKALDVSTNMMNRFPDLKAIYCCNDTMALGVVQAAKNNDKLDNIIIVGTDGIDEAVKSVKKGEMNATIAQDPYKMGTIAVETLVKLVKTGKEKADTFDILVPSKIITE